MASHKNEYKYFTKLMEPYLPWEGIFHGVHVIDFLTHRSFALKNNLFGKYIHPHQTVELIQNINYQDVAPMRKINIVYECTRASELINDYFTSIIAVTTRKAH